MACVRAPPPSESDRELSSAAIFFFVSGPLTHPYVRPFVHWPRELVYAFRQVPSTAIPSLVGSPNFIHLRLDSFACRTIPTGRFFDENEAGSKAAISAEACGTFSGEARRLGARQVRSEYRGGYRWSFQRFRVRCSSNLSCFVLTIPPPVTDRAPTAFGLGRVRRGQNFVVGKLVFCSNPIFVSNVL